MSPVTCPCHLKNPVKKCPAGIIFDAPRRRGAPQITSLYPALSLASWCDCAVVPSKISSHHLIDWRLLRSVGIARMTYVAGRRGGETSSCSIVNAARTGKFSLAFLLSFRFAVTHSFVTSKRDVKTRKTEASTNLKDSRTIHVSYRIESQCWTEK